MKILFLTESLMYGGKERQMVELVKSISKMPEYDCRIIITEEEIHFKEIIDLGIKIDVVKRKVKKDFSLFRKIYKIVKAYNPDIICPWGQMVAFYSIPAKILLNKPMINCEVLSAPDFINNRWYHWFRFRFSDLVISNSFAGIKAFNVPLKKSKVIYSGIDISSVRATTEAKEILSDFKIDSRFLIVMVGSFSKHKDYQTYIKAAIIVLNKRNDVTFFAIGKGDSSECYSIIPDKFKNRILFPGPVDDVYSIMSVSTIGLLSTFTEGLPNVVMEFMTLEKPVIATDGGGTKELLVDGETGLLVSRENPDEMADKINYLLDNNDKATLMGKNGRMRIENDFLMTKMTDLFLETFQKYRKAI